MGLNPQHVVPSWDLKTLWVANNAERTPHGSLTPIDPKTAAGQGDPGRRSVNMYYSPDGKSRSSSRGVQRLDFRDPQTFRTVFARGAALRGINPPTFDRRALRDLTCEFSGGVTRSTSSSARCWVTCSSSCRQATKVVKGPDGKDETICTVWKGMPQDIRVSPDGSTWYNRRHDEQRVYVVDGATFTQVDFLATGIGSHGCTRRATARSSTSRIAVAMRSTARPGQGRGVRHRLRRAEDRGDVADPGGGAPTWAMSAPTASSCGCPGAKNDVATCSTRRAAR